MAAVCVCFVTHSPSLCSQWWQPQHLHFARCLLGWKSLWIENQWSKWTVCPCKDVSLRQSWEMLSAQHVCKAFLEIRRHSRTVPSISGTDVVFPTCSCFHTSHFCSHFCSGGAVSILVQGFARWAPPLKLFRCFSLESFFLLAFKSHFSLFLEGHPETCLL